MSEASPRPWWVPILGVGSIGLGGFQGLGALAMAYAGAEMGGDAANVFFRLAAAWILPGVLLAASGVAIVAGARSGRVLALAAVGAMAVSLALVTVNRSAIPGAVASLVEYGEAKGGAGGIVKKFREREGGDPVASLRDPDQAAISAWVFTAECGCGMPWYLLVLAACALPAGRAMATPTPPGEGRTPAP